MSSKKLKFIFGVHNHQPIGNFDFIFSEATQKAYEPYLDFLKENPDFKSVLHYSGILLEWFEENRPDLLEKINFLIERGQIEILSGGYYEPIMCSIKYEDRLLQIEKLNSKLSSFFGIKPRGIWLAERVWEANYPTFLNEAEIEYTVLDDYHFKTAGFSSSDLNGYYVTEDNNNSLFIFPINMKLRYLIPFGTTEEVAAFLENIYQNFYNPVVVFMDDGEKLGEWPGTHKLVYKERWLEKFYKTIQKMDFVEFATFSDVLDEYKPSGRAYLPANSYREMVEWSLPTEKYELYQSLKRDLEEIGVYNEMEDFFQPDGYWRNFFVKYPEVNRFHKRMIMERERYDIVKTILKERKNSQYHSDLEKLEEALDYILKAQCNCAYWHGTFGGVYYPHLRRSIYENIIKASSIMDSILFKNSDFIEAYQSDFDCDGYDEVIIRSSKQNLVFRPKRGGKLICWEIPHNIYYNLINTVSRKMEFYHKELLQQYPELNKKLYFDWYLKDSFLDHFFAKETNLEAFNNGFYGEQGDFIKNPYLYRINVYKNKIAVEFKREGLVWDGEKSFPVEVKKEFVFDRISPFTGIKANYRVINKSKQKLFLNFGIENNFFFSKFPEASFEGEKILVERPLAKENVFKFELKSFYPEFFLNLGSNKKSLLWLMPLFTVIGNRVSYEEIFQGITVVHSWEMELGPEEDWGVELKFWIEKEMIERGVGIR